MKKIYLILILFINLIFISSCKLYEDDVEAYEHTFWSMSTLISVRFYDEENHEKYFEEMKQIFGDIASKTSDYNSGLIYTLNNERKVIYDETLLDILEYADYCMNFTEGYFNPYMGKLTHLWKEYLNNTDNNAKAPDEATINLLLSNANDTSFRNDNNYIYLDGYGDIDLGGIAKGYALEKCKEYLKEEGCKYYLIDAGQSSISYTSKKDKDIRAGLYFGDTNYGYVKAKNIDISTSSPEYQYKYDAETNRKYHHIISPKDGYPKNYYESVNVFNDNAALGDVLSTALFSMDLDTLKSFTKANNIKCVCYNKEILYKSEGCDFIHES